jgi:hypothetical protein
MVGSEAPINIRDLRNNKPHSTMKVVRINTKFGPSILFTIKDDSDLIRVFLPKRYFNMFIDDDINEINEEKQNCK